MTQDQTPSLRFPEFRGAGAWEMKKLGEVCDLQDGYAFSPKNFTNSAIDAIQVIRITDINNKNKNADKVYVHASLVKILKLDKYMVQEGDLLLSLTGAAGFNFFFWNSKPALINQRTMKIMAKEKLNTTLLKLLEPLIHTEINSHGTGQNNNVSKETLKHTLSFLPKPDEQQKIAACLSSLDEVITIHGDRLDRLKDYKTGLIQQLFPANGQTTPTLRFPEFQGKDPWEAKAGNEVFAQISNKEHDSNFPILAITQEHGAIPRDAIDYHVSVSEKSIANYKVVEIADFIISLRSFQGGIEYSNYKGLCSPAYVILRRKKDECEDYFKYFFKTERFIKDLNKNIEGLRDGKMISYKQFSELFLPIPPLAEQQKIADCLSALDDLITVQKQKIKDLNNHKNGLMQQLFPEL